jgi:hypothetical protein
VAEPGYRVRPAHGHTPTQSATSRQRRQLWPTARRPPGAAMAGGLASAVRTQGLSAASGARRGGVEDQRPVVGQTSGVEDDRWWLGLAASSSRPQVPVWESGVWTQAIRTHGPLYSSSICPSQQDSLLYTQFSRTHSSSISSSIHSIYCGTHLSLYLNISMCDLNKSTNLMVQSKFNLDFWFVSYSIFSFV